MPRRFALRKRLRSAHSGNPWDLWWKNRERDLVRPVTPVQLWKATAAARERAGDPGGAERARFNASISGRVRTPRRPRKKLDPNRNYRMHWQPWDERVSACHTPWPRNMTPLAEDSNCGNCSRTKWWPPGTERTR